MQSQGGQEKDCYIWWFVFFFLLLVTDKKKKVESEQEKPVSAGTTWAGAKAGLDLFPYVLM